MCSKKRRQRRKSKQPKNTEEQLKQTEESSMPDAVLAAPDVSGDSPDDASPVEDCSEEEVIATEPELSQLQPEDVDKWKAQIRELYLAASRRSSESAGTALQQEPTSSTCLCRGCSDGEKPQGPLHSTKPRGRKEFEKKRIIDPDTPLPYSYVRNTLLKYESVDDRLKDVGHKYRKLIRWKLPVHTAVMLMVALLMTWMGLLLQLVVAQAVFHIVIKASNKYSDMDSDGTEPVKDTSSRCSRETDLMRIVRLDGRCSNKFKELSTVFDKTKSLFTWKNTRVSFCFLFVLVTLTMLAFWKGQEFAVQVAVTAILLKVFVVDTVFRHFPHLAARYDLIGRAWNQLPVRCPESPTNARNADRHLHVRRVALGSLLCVADADRSRQPSEGRSSSPLLAEPEIAS